MGKNLYNITAQHLVSKREKFQRHKEAEDKREAGRQKGKARKPVRAMEKNR